MDTWTHKYTATRRYPSYNRLHRFITVEAGLHKLGNQRPYFSVTAHIARPNTHNWDSCGCLHEDIAHLFPKLIPVIAMHLCDDNGQPMHAEGNGWYALAGYYGGAGEQYHAGNSKGHYCDEYREPTTDECLQRFANHVRIPIEEAKRIADIWRADAPSLPAIRGMFAQWLAGQADRFQADADATIAILDSLILAQQTTKAAKAAKVGV